MTRKTVLCAVGTRPEAVKMAPVIQALRARSDRFATLVVATAQHRDLLDGINATFGIVPDIDLDLMTAGQAPGTVVSKVIDSVTSILRDRRPDVILAQGDTATVMATATACFLEKTPFGHVEAGLRTGDINSPFPEEFNRRVATLAATYHFAPTDGARSNLLAEGVSPSHIFVTGNTVVDAMRLIFESHSSPPPSAVEAPYVLMTCHRRESFGQPMRNAFRAIREFAIRHPEIRIWYPVHPNPHVQEAVAEILAGIRNVLITGPLDYVSFLYAIRGSLFLVTDSGGVQEEAATLGKPLVVLRDTTERPEAVKAGISRLVGTASAVVLQAMEQMLTKETLDRSACMASRAIYGDGHAAARIVDAIGC